MHCAFKEQIQKIWNWIRNDPKYFVRITVLFVCSIVVVFQLQECFSKLRFPPITTHSHFDLNRSLTYPALTFCRDPPYKRDVLEKYNLVDHPKYAPHWRKFPFETTKLSTVFKEATYDLDEFFMAYSLNMYPENLDMVSTLHFNMGRCYTILPKITTIKAWKNAGYSILLKHDISTLEESSSVDNPPGWHVFIHEPSEPFTENRMQLSGRVEYIYVETNQETEIKLNAQHFKQISSRDGECTSDPFYSETRCEEICLWRKATENMQCGGPWMSLGLEDCNNFTTISSVINNYNFYDTLDENFCVCKERCKSVIYSGFVMNRKPFEMDNKTAIASQIYIYFNSKMVTMVEERPNYDLSQFVADMGGSLGFLLGLSVLGLIGLLEKILLLVFSILCPKIDKKSSETNRVELGKSPSMSSISEKCTNLNRKPTKDGNSVDIGIELPTYHVNNLNNKNYK